ncbi:MAG: hypothetical protein WCS43_07210 [Verrucomicrobiota bacterium]
MPIAEHLIGLGDFDPEIRRAKQGLTQAVRRSCAHAGLETRAEIHTQTVGRLMVQGGDQAFSGCHRFHGFGLMVLLNAMKFLLAD